MIYATPQPIDVLGGRGNKAFSHPGNKNLRSRIVQLLDNYKECQTRKAKSAIVQSTVDKLQADGARFLKFDASKKEWFDAGYKEARLKVSHAFRDASIPNKVKCIEALKAEKDAPLTTTPKKPANYASFPLSLLLSQGFTSFVASDSPDRSSPDRSSLPYSQHHHKDDFDDVHSVSSLHSSIEEDFETNLHHDIEPISPAFPCQTEFEPEDMRAPLLQFAFSMKTPIAGRKSISLVDDILKDLDEESYQASATTMSSWELDELLNMEDLDFFL